MVEVLVSLYRGMCLGHVVWCVQGEEVSVRRSRLSIGVEGGESDDQALFFEFIKRPIDSGSGVSSVSSHTCLTRPGASFFVVISICDFFEDYFCPPRYSLNA